CYSLYCLPSRCMSLYLSSCFFPSRRRHARSKRDWSSDVCSSDLARRSCPRRLEECPHVFHGWVFGGGVVGFVLAGPGGFVVAGQIGRASCRERVERGRQDEG